MAYVVPRKNSEFFDKLDHGLILTAFVLCCVAASVALVLLII